MEILINAEASHQGLHSFVKETKEDLTDDELDDSDEDQGDNRRGVIIELSGNPGEQKIASVNVQGQQGNLTKPNEAVGKSHGPGELKTVLKVEQESILSSGDEILSGNGNERVSSFVDIINTVLDALKQATSDRNKANDEAVLTGGLNHLLSSELKENPDDVEDGDNEGSESNSANVILVGIADGCANLSLTILFIGRVEVVGGCSDHGNERGFSGDEVHEPDQTENHDDEHVPPKVLITASWDLESSSLRNRSGVSFDFTHGVDAYNTKSPNSNHHSSNNEVDDGNDHDSRGVSQEISRSINDADCGGELVESAAEHDSIYNREYKEYDSEESR